MISFKKYLMVETAVGKHGEYANDVAEKTMVHAIINTLMGGQKTEDNYDIVYSFIESDKAKSFYEKYYDAFAEKAEIGKSRETGAPKNLSPEASRILADFKNDLKELFNRWKKQQNG